MIGFTGPPKPKELQEPMRRFASLGWSSMAVSHCALQANPVNAPDAPTRSGRLADLQPDRIAISAALRQAPSQWC